MVITASNQNLTITTRIINVSKDSMRKLTKCQVLHGGKLSQKRSFCVLYKN